MSEQKGPTADELKKLVLLHDVASSVMKLEKRGAEYWACCPFHGEDTPSFKIEEHKGCEVFHCLAGETSVLTWNGTFPIHDLAGKTVRILNRVGQWVDAPFFSFGVQPLWNIKVSRNGIIKNLRATAEHRWFVRSGVRRCTEREVTTENLKVGHRLASVFPRCSISTVRPSPIGIAAGFVFGDGHVHKFGSVAQFCGEKDAAILPYFNQCHIAKYDDVTCAFDLPIFFKARPSIDECATYLYGWLAGYFAADGCVSDDGTASLASASIDNLEFVRLVATRLGIGTYGIRSAMRMGFGKEETPLYSVSFLSSTLRENFFLIPEHRARFLSNQKEYERKHWTVISVEPANVEEEVFCAIVDDGHAFILEDNILTGNCFGCGKSGSVVDFLELHEHLTTAEAFKRLNELAGTTEWREAAKKVQETFKNIGDAPKKTIPLAAWKPREDALLKSFEAVDWLTRVRGISIETAQALHFGFSQSTTSKSLRPENEFCRDKGWIMFPRIVGDKIVAVKARSLVCKEFTQSAGMDAKALFNADTVNMLEPVFVVEGECDAAIMEQADFRTVSIPNATTKITPEWKVILKRAPYVVLAGDNDGAAGSDKMRLLQNELGENTHLLLWPDAKDANDFFREQCNRDVQVFREKVLAMVEASKSMPVDGFMSIIQRLRSSVGTDGENDPFRLHFSIKELDRMAYIPIDAGYCIFYSTYSGTGKSVFVTQMMIEEAHHDQVVVVYSPELSGSAYLALVAAQTLPERNINRSLVVTQADYIATADKLDVPTVSGAPFQFYVGHSMTGGDPLAFIEMTLKVIRPTRFVIDTFPCIVVKQRGESQVDAESRTASSLEALGKKYGCIFVVIGQSNKEAEDIKEKRRDSHGVLRGSRVLYDKAHAVYLIHRKKKEDAAGQLEPLEAATLIKMEKNRTAGPGAQAIYLTYVREKSRFYLQDGGAAPTTAPEPEHDQPPGDVF